MKDKTLSKVRLGVNIDHIATLRQLRAGLVDYPDVVQAAVLACHSGADQITIHLRSDRRHIQDSDVVELCRLKPAPINLEMAAADEMIEVALKNRPHAVCLVPEKREELTTEGGLDVIKHEASIIKVIKALRPAGIQISLFIEADPDQVQKSAVLTADAVEFHTGQYALANTPEGRIHEIGRLRDSFVKAHELKLAVHAGHGLDYGNIHALSQLPFLEEVNIGHSIVCRAALVGLGNAVKEMKIQLEGAS